MEKNFWNTRYGENKAVYGTEPNHFFKQFIDNHKPGTLLLPAEGEGRNAVYAAKKGWQVDAFDFSEVAMSRAMQLAGERHVHINYWVEDIASFKATKTYDAVGLICVHLPAGVRKVFHEQAYRSLKSGGYLVLEAFAKEQILYESGGPRDSALLYSAPMICNDFPFLHLLSCGQKEIELSEGKFHKGKAVVLRMIGQKL
jgi:SAM-dependent methyltransferase